MKLLEMLEPKIKSLKPTTEKQEEGWIVGPTGKPTHTIGKADAIEISASPSELHDASTIVHTHTAPEPSPFTALPSVQDLQSALEAHNNFGIESVIKSGPYYTKIKPTRKNATIHNYEQTVKKAVKQNDINIVLQKLKSLGFNTEIGEC